jgi:hypothetical protein
MTKPKFTPGPWKVVVAGFFDDRPSYTYYEIMMNNRTEISKSNAVLIESAPELYNALKSREWENGTRGGGGGYINGEIIMHCPKCGRLKSEGHSDDCNVGNALKKAVRE